MGLCDCLPPFTIEKNEVLHVLVQFHKASRSYILRTIKVKDQRLGEHRHMYFKESHSEKHR